LWAVIGQAHDTTGPQEAWTAVQVPRPHHAVRAHGSPHAPARRPWRRHAAARGWGGSWGGRLGPCESGRRRRCGPCAGVVVITAVQLVVLRTRREHHASSACFAFLPQCITTRSTCTHSAVVEQSVRTSASISAALRGEAQVCRKILCFQMLRAKRLPFQQRCFQLQRDAEKSQSSGAA
jgi:hypothetical protein